METIEITTNGESNIVKIKGTLTAGKIHALMNALEASQSAIAYDVLCLLRNAIHADSQKNPNSPIKDAVGSFV